MIREELVHTTLEALCCNSQVAPVQKTINNNIVFKMAKKILNELTMGFPLSLQLKLVFTTQKG